jgi:predicted transcriptional regulator
MEIHFTPEQQTQLSRLASRFGTDAECLVRKAVSRMLKEEASFLEGVERGIAAAERGEFVEPDEVWANVEKLLQP